jgi:hypothetical protein
MVNAPNPNGFKCCELSQTEDKRTAIKGTPHSEEQIIAILKLGEPGLTTAETHRPAVIGSGRCRAVHAVPADPPSLPSLHRQSFLAVRPIHALVVGRYFVAHEHRRRLPDVAPAYTGFFATSTKPLQWQWRSERPSSHARESKESGACVTAGASLPVLRARA